MSFQRINAFLRSQVGTLTADGRVVRFDLRHMANGKLGQQVHTVDTIGADPGPDLDEWFESVASQFMISGEDDAKAIGGFQTYVIVSYRDKSDDPKARCAFSVQGGSPEESTDYGELNSEPATNSGLLRQLMRHNEATYKALVMNTTSMLNAMSRGMDRLGRTVDELQSKRFEEIELIETLLTHKHERELEAAREANHEENMKELFNNVKLLGPAVLNRITKGKDGDNNPALYESMLLQFFNSLSDTQREEIFSRLSDTQKIALSEIIQQAVSKTA